MYSEKIMESVRKVEALRQENLSSEQQRMTAAEKEALLAS